MDIQMQVEMNTRDIARLQESHEKILGDHGKLLGLYEAQKRAVETLRTDLKEDLNELKTDNRAAIQELKQDLTNDQRQRDEKHQREKAAAEQKWPRRAHIVSEGLLAAIAALEYVQHLAGKW